MIRTDEEIKEQTKDAEHKRLFNIVISENISATFIYVQ